MTDDWSPVVVKAEVAGVRRCLGSVIRMCEAGNVVHFESGNTYIQTVLSGQKTCMMSTGNLYVVDMWVPKHQAVGLRKPELQRAGNTVRPTRKTTNTRVRDTMRRT